MKVSKIFAGLAAAAVAASAMAVSSFAIKDYPDGYTLDLIAEGYDVTSVAGFTFKISGDIDSGTGGGVGFNSATTGWDSTDWGNADAGKAINASGGEVTIKRDAPVFKESDVTDPTNPYAQIWMQQWWGSDVTIDSVVVLDVDGNALTPSTGAAADDSADSSDAAADTGVSIDTVMVIQENATWATTKSANVTITGAGDYTYTLDGLSIDPATLTVLYIKDASCVDSDPAAGYTATIPDGSAVVKSFKINGNDVALSGDSSLYDDAGKIIDMCFFNTWAAKETFFDAPADTIESVEVTISVSASDAAAPAPVAETAETVEVVEDEDEGIELVEEDAEPAPVVEDVEPVEVVETAPEVVEAAPEVVETAPAVQETAPVKTGNTAAAAIAVVMVAAGAAAVISKRK